MKIHQIITDFDDQDAYKFFMNYAVFRLYPNAVVKYKFINRGKHQFPEGFAEELESQIQMMTNVTFTPQIERFFRAAFKTPNGIPYFDEGYYGFLRSYRYNPSQVKVKQYGTDLEIEIEGPWIETIYWETQILPMISELYYIMTGEVDKARKGKERDEYNELKFQGFITLGIKVTEFGLRRRFSKEEQGNMIKTFIKVAPSVFQGTSNVMFARLFNVLPKGTQAHEWYMFHGAKYGVEMANYMALQNWITVYQGSLGIALTDTYGTENFFKNFSILHSKIYDGLRQDSACPLKFTEKAFDHYNSINVKTNHKLLFYSDNLNSYEKLKNIEECAKKRFITSYGMGTWLSNDTGVKPTNMVIKMTFAKTSPEKPWIPCVKISDEPAKSMGGTDEAVSSYKKTLNIQ